MTSPPVPDQATVGDHLAALSRPAPAQQLPEPATFDGPPSLTAQTLRVGNLSKICPANGRPDQFRVELIYTPTAGRCVEIDSFVRHLEGFHHLAVSAEMVADQVAAAVLEATGAARVEVTVHQIGREGGEVQATARYPTHATDSGEPPPG